MKNMKKIDEDCFVFYKSYYDAIQTLPKAQQEKALSAIIKYAFFRQEPKEKGAFLCAFFMAKPLIEKSQLRYKTQCENGAKGGRPKTQNSFGNNPTETQKSSQQNLKDKDNDNDKEEDNVNYNGNSNPNGNPNSNPNIFVPPTLEEVMEYNNERDNNANAQGFHDYYAAKGWKLGKNDMKDWKAAFRRWEVTERRKRANPPKGLNNFAPRHSGDEFKKIREEINESRTQELFKKARENGVNV